MARFLKESAGYVKNKKSNHSNRFDFKFNKEQGCICIFNAKKGENLYLWPEFITLADILGLTHYIYYDNYDRKDVVVRIY